MLNNKIELDLDTLDTVNGGHYSGGFPLTHRGLALAEGRLNVMLYQDAQATRSGSFHLSTRF